MDLKSAAALSMWASTCGRLSLAAASAAEPARMRHKTNPRNRVRIKYWVPESALRLRRGKRHEPLDFLFGIDNWFQPDHLVFLACSCLEQVAGLGCARCFGTVRKLLGIHPEDRFAVSSADHHDAIGARLIAKPFSGRQKNEGDDEPDHDVVLPSGAWIIPKQKALHAAHWTTHANTSLSRAPGAPWQ